MAKGITRTLQTTEIKVAKFENGGLVELPSIVEDKVVTKEDAIKIVNRKHKNEQAIVTDVIVSEPVLRRISLEDFVKYSEVIEKKEEQKTTDEYIPTEEEVRSELQEAL